MAVTSAKDLRPRLRAERAAIDIPHAERSERLATAVMSHHAITALAPHSWVTCYSSYRDEPPTRLLLQRLCDAGLQVLVPAVHGHNLHWHDVTGEIDDPKAWTRDSYGIPLPTTPEVATTAHELLTLGGRGIITPGLGMAASTTASSPTCRATATAARTGSASRTSAACSPTARSTCSPTTS